MKKIIPLFLFAFIVFCAKGQWSNNPSVNTLVCNKLGIDGKPISVSDGSNGSIIFFADDFNEELLHVQRITTAGMVAWGSSSSPVNVSVSDGVKEDVSAVGDGAGGAFVAWTDFRHNEDIGEIYIQKISATGIAQWTVNGLRVTNNTSRDDLQPLLCIDGLGGVIVTWFGDDSVAKNIQSYAQRYNSAGAAQWTANGIVVCTAAGFRASSSILSDGANGAFIFFVDTRNDPIGLVYDDITDEDTDLTNADIYGQRLNASGTRLWGDGGAAIITAPGNQNSDLISNAIPDGSGNIILVFDDGRNDDGSFINYDIFAQKVNSNGVPQWAAGGVAVCTAAENQFINDVVSDGAGGAVVSINYLDISRFYAQRITNAGAISWALNGVPVTLEDEIVSGGVMAADGSGNTIFAYNSGDNNSVKAQKLNMSGVKQWGVSGTIVCNSPFGINDDPAITSSNAGSVIIAWSDNRNFLLPSTTDIYASKVLTNGVLSGAAAISYTSIANGNWNNPATWQGGVVPPVGAVVIIRHNVTGNINATCASIKVESPGNFSVNTGIIITITN
jgi:hypothetical protein